MPGVQNSIVEKICPKQESVSLVTMNTAAVNVTPESDLVQEGFTTTPTHVETRLRILHGVIMVTSTSRPWDTSWYSENKQNTQAIMFVKFSLYCDHIL